jgi:hypothetical protein
VGGECDGEEGDDWSESGYGTSDCAGFFVGVNFAILVGVESSVIPKVKRRLGGSYHFVSVFIDECGSLSELFSKHLLCDKLKSTSPNVAGMNAMFHG